MKNILLLSDTHGTIDDFILKYAAKADEIWHAGDIGDIKVTDALAEHALLRAVYGNIDGGVLRSEFPLHQRFNCEGLEVWMTHIAGSPGRYRPEVRYELQANSPGLFICGHAHILKVQFDNRFQCLFMNPGAAGCHGFHQVRTMLRFQVETGKVKSLEVIEKER